jgi:hypothetical protein
MSWSDGGAASHTVAPPVTPTTYTATYTCTAGCGFAPALTVSLVQSGSVRLQWGSLTCASSYDVTRGDLTMLKNSAGNFISSTMGCAMDNTTNTSLTYHGSTSPGSWFLVRGNGCSPGYDEMDSSQIGSRNAEIGASGTACP